MNGIYVSTSHDPYRNLATEEFLLNHCAGDRCLLYLWQNAHTVVIGKNQNPWKECNTTLLEQEGGHLARRLSGGGAVYHDLGNLNFTFLMPRGCFDKAKQFSVILEALAGLGIEATLSGRNDMEIAGRKFSGSAFYQNGRQAYHHGTLLLDADLEKLNRYLSPSKAKLSAKGVDSVRSRVVNLRTVRQELTLEALTEALKAAFVRIYGAAEELTLAGEAEIQALARHYGSWDWICGQKLPFTLACEGRFPWGGLELQLQVEGGVIRQAKVYTDAMDWSLAGRSEKALMGCPLEPGAIAARLRDQSDVAKMLIDNL